MELEGRMGRDRGKDRRDGGRDRWSYGAREKRGKDYQECTKGNYSPSVPPSVTECPHSIFTSGVTEGQRVGGREIP
jgi:hypothetical protein